MVLKRDYKQGLRRLDCRAAVDPRLVPSILFNRPYALAYSAIRLATKTSYRHTYPVGHLTPTTTPLAPWLPPAPI